MTERDMQKQRVYRAERVVYHGKRLETVAEIEAYVKRVRSNAALLRRYRVELGMWAIFVGDGRSRANAGGDSRGIYMPQWSRCELIVLHELAHTIHARTARGHVEAAHGWQWAAIYLNLVHFMMGKTTADALKASFRNHRVRFAAKRKVVMTEEAKAVLRQRLAVARAAKEAR